MDEEHDLMVTYYGISPGIRKSPIKKQMARFLEEAKKTLSTASAALNPTWYEVAYVQGCSMALSTFT